MFDIGRMGRIGLCRSKQHDFQRGARGLVWQLEASALDFFV